LSAEGGSGAGSAAGRVSREVAFARGWCSGRTGSSTGGPRGGGETARLVHELGGVDVLDRLQDRERILRILHRLAVKLAAVRLVIFLSNSLLPDRGVDGEPEQRLRHLVRVGAARLLDALGEELHA